MCSSYQAETAKLVAGPGPSKAQPWSQHLSGRFRTFRATIARVAFEQLCFPSSQNKAMVQHQLLRV